MEKYKGLSDKIHSLELPSLEHQKTLDIFKELCDTTQKLFLNEFEINLIEWNGISRVDRDHLTLKTFTSFMNLSGAVQLKAIITIEYPLAKKLLEKFGFFDVAAEEENNFLESVVSEVLNTIIGNSTNSLSEKGYLISFDTPFIMSSEEATFKFPHTIIWNRLFENSAGNLTLYIVKGN